MLSMQASEATHFGFRIDRREAVVPLPKSKVVSALLFALGATAVASVAPTAASTKAVAKTNPVNESQYGFSFSLPSNWRAVPLNSADAAALLNAAKNIDPALANVLDSQLVQAEKQGLKVYAVGPVTGTFFPNLNIGIESSAGSPTGQAFLSALDAVVKIDLTEAGVQNIRTSDVQLPMGRALKVTYRLPLKTTHSLIDVGEQLYLEHGAHIYVLTFSSLSLAQDQAVSLVVDNTWRWT